MQKYADKIINNVEESIVVVDSTYNILSVNEQTEALLNLDKKEIIGKQFNKIFNIIDSECILKSLLQNYNSPIKNQRCTLEINGDYKRVESHVEIIKNAKSIYGAIVFLRDITKFEKTQKVLKESEEKFRSLYNSMISAYTLREIIYDDLGEPIDFKYLEVNPAFEKLTGIKRSNIIGKTYKEVYPNGKPYWLKVYKQAAKTGEPVDYENWMDSTNKYLKVHIFKVAKDLLGIITVDITDKKLLEDALYKEREHFKNLYSSMQNGYALCEMILDEDKLDFRYLDVNPAFLEMTNINREEVVGERASSVFSKGVKMDYNRTFDLARQYKEAAVNGETKRFDMYSNVMQREIEVVVYGFGDGRFAVEFIDISERKRLREELIKEREKYYNLFNSMLDGFVLMDVLYDDSNKPIDFVVIDINPASEKKTGFSSDEVKDKKVSEVFLNSEYSLERSMPTLFELYDQAKEKIDTHEANGYIEAFGKYLFISAFIPKKGQFAIIMRDFTEQKSLEDEVFREKEQFKSLFENTLSGFAMNEVIFNENGNPTDFIPRLVNPAFLEITNMPEKEIIGVPASVIFNYDNMNEWPNNSLIHDYAKVIKTGKPIRKEYYSTSFGKYLDVSISLVRGNTVAVSFNDISEKKEAEAKLQWNLSILKQAQDIAKIGSWEYYNKTEEIWLSEEAAKIYGLNTSGYLEVSEVVSQVHRKDMEKYKEYFYDMNYKDTGEIDFTHRILSSEGNVRHVHLKGVVSGEVENFVISGVVQDITELITAQEDLITSEAKYRTIINNTSDAVIIYDKNLNVTYRSGNIERLFGWRKKDFEEKGSFDLLHPDDKRKVFKIFENILERGPGAREEFEVRIRNKKGELRYTKNTIVNMLDDPHINGLLINYYDITEAKEREQEIYYLSTYDELTGLYNRSYFERNESEFIKEENLPITIIMGDLNGLKLINDMFGHSEGDKLLKVMADIIKESCGNKAIPIRFGGDEYCVILYNTDCQQAERVIEDIKDTYKFHDDIAVAIEHGYISGYSDNTIRPKKLITKEEVGSILSRLYKNEIELEKILIRDKTSISDWCNKSVQKVVTSKVMDLEEGCFYPKKKLTKIEAKRYIINLKYINDKCFNINKPGIYDLEGKSFLNININSKGVSIKNFECDKLTIDHKGKTIVANAKIKKLIHKFNEKELNLCNLKIKESMQLSYIYNVIKIKSIRENSFSICKAENIEKIVLDGKYNEIGIKETSSNIVLVENVKIEKLEISNNSGKTEIENKLNSDIDKLILNSKSEFLGLGRIDFAKGGALEESIFRRLPNNLRSERKETSKKQELFNVIFYDYYGDIAKKQSVNEGQSATPPELANVGQNLFDGWDKSYNSINSNLDIYPIYKKLDDSKEMKIKELGSKGDLSQEENVYKIDDNTVFGYKTLVIKKSKMPFNLDKYEKYTYKMNDLVKEFEENIFDNDLILVNISQFAKDETIEDSTITAYLN